MALLPELQKGDISSDNLKPSSFVLKILRAIDNSE